MSSLTYGRTCEDERNGSGRLSNWRWRKASLSGFTRVYSPTMTVSRISSVCTPLRWPSLQKRIAGAPLISSIKSTLSAGTRYLKAIIKRLATSSWPEMGWRLARTLPPPSAQAVTSLASSLVRVARFPDLQAATKDSVSWR